LNISTSRFHHITTKTPVNPSQSATRRATTFLVKA
jgi:hypothetical protein